jgi:ArsR family transcriptional regulator, arsenate/arsenite/antimonite-responsive transcriptional repressor
MSLIEIYQCLCDETRLRILNLLSHGALCVCHFQKLLKEPQVKISKHLAYLKAHQCVEARRHGNWMVYALPKNPSLELKSNLKCLQDCVQSDKRFQQDIEALKKMKNQTSWVNEVCCSVKTKARVKTSS